jgi:hypothetical protein
MKKFSSLFFPVVGGLLLVALGVLLFLNNLDVIDLDWSLLIGPVFALGGLVFLFVFIFDRKNWWALIPAFTLLGLGAIILLGALKIPFVETLSGAILFFAIGLSFWLIYINNTSNWWAIIPGGVLWSLAAVTLLPEETWLSRGIFFLGLGLTFLLVYLLPKAEGRMKWALYPAAALFLVGLLASIGASNWFRFIWPVALLAGGIVLLFLAILKKT